MILNDFGQYVDCDCGRKHSITTELVVIERGCLRSIDDYVGKIGLCGKKLALYDTNTFQAVNCHPKSDQVIVLNADGLHANEQSVQQVFDEIHEDIKVIYALGSGTINDIARYVAAKLGIDFVSCPTAASVDGFCSSVAAMTFDGIKITVGAVAPKAVIADLDVITCAPLFLARSGMGDILGKYISLTDWKIAHLLTNEYYCQKVADLTLNAVEKTVKSGKGILCGKDESYSDLMLALVLSGIAMQMVGNSRPASGAEHHLSHFLTIAPKTSPYHSDALHGESVGVGTIIMTEVYHKAVERVPIFDKNTIPPPIDALHGIFASVADSIIKENKDDCLGKVDFNSLQSNWRKVVELINAIPSESRMKQLFAEFGLKQSLSDIGVSESVKNDIVRLCPYMRNRLTFARLLWQIR